MKTLHAGLALILPLLAAAASAATPPVIWQLTDPASVGGQVTEVWGAPQALPDGGLRFNGTSDGVLVPVNPLAGWDKFTIAILFRQDADGPFAQRFLHAEDGKGERMTFESRVVAGKGWYMDTFLAGGRAGGAARPPAAAGAATIPSSRALIDPAKLHPLDQWYWGELVYDGHTMTAYVNGVQELTGPVALPAMGSGQISLGVRQNKVYWFKGEIKEVRFYPAALAPADLPQAP